MQQQATMTTGLWGYVTGAGVWERYMGNLICIVQREWWEENLLRLSRRHHCGHLGRRWHGENCVILLPPFIHPNNSEHNSTTVLYPPRYQPTDMILQQCFIHLDTTQLT